MTLETNKERGDLSLNTLRLSETELDLPSGPTHPAEITEAPRGHVSHCIGEPHRKGKWPQNIMNALSVPRGACP